MRIVLIAYYYPPDPAVGGLRAAKVARAMVSRGHAVDVIAATLPGPAGERADTDGDGIRVHRVARSFDLRNLASRVGRRLRPGRRTEGEPTVALTPAAPGAWNRPAQQPAWKRHVMSALWLPDDRQGWIRPAAGRAIECVERGAQLVYTTSPPASVQIAGWLVKRRTGARWAMEFRDPWTDNPWKPAFVRSAWSDAAERWLERRCLRAADHVIAVTESTGRRLMSRMKTDHVIIARNGIDPYDRTSSGRTGPPAIVYVGNLYDERDPRPFFRAIGRLRQRRLLPEGTRIDFVGDCQFYEGMAVDGLADECGIADWLTCVGRRPHAECMDRMAAADVLLLLAQGQPEQVPNKLYEYFAVGRPIVAYTDQESETMAMVQLAKGHYTVTGEDAAQEDAAILGALRAARDTAQPQQDEGVLAQWSTERQMALLLDELGL